MIAILSASLVLIAHNVFQVWLYMKPCEQCVYIRFAFLCMTFGCLFPIVFPKSLACRIISYVCGVYGCIYGIMCSLKLDSIHRAIHSDDLDAMFGMQGCSLTGDCGYDNSDVPMGTVLSPLQESIINMYNDAGGWYLIPSMKFMSMAQCCLLGFTVALLIYIVLFSGMIVKRRADAQK